MTDADYPDHLREMPSGRICCTECGRQITVGPSGTEYGHAKASTDRHGERCPKRPASVDPRKGWGGKPAHANPAEESP